MDESGDLGFNKYATKTFVIGYFVADNPPKLSRALRKLKSRLSERCGIKIRELKFNRDREEVRWAVLDLIAGSEVRCGFAAINKGVVEPDLKSPLKFYNCLAVNSVLKKIVRTLRPNEIEYVVNKRAWSKRRRDGFDQYVRSRALWAPELECGYSVPDIALRCESPRSDPCLQIADYIAASVFRLSERRNRKYLSKIDERIAWRDVWGPL